MERRKIVYPNLKAEIARNGDTIEQLSKLLNISEISFWRRLSGIIEWKISEANILSEHYNMNIEELFKKN